MPNNTPNKQKSHDNTKRTSPNQNQDQPMRQSSERKGQQPHEDQRNATNRSRDR